MQIHNTPYYESYEIDNDSLSTLGYEGLAEEKDLADRKIYLLDRIDYETVDPIIKQILRYNDDDANKKEHEREAIILYISSDGGDAFAASALIDVMMASTTPIITINTGRCCSSAAFIYLAGKYRLAFKNSFFLFHDGTVAYPSESPTKIASAVLFDEDFNERIYRFAVDRTRICYTDLVENVKNEWYMFADEAKDYGVCNLIFGKDVDLNCEIL